MNWAKRVLWALTLWGCAQAVPVPGKWGHVHSFACQLHNLNLLDALASPHQLLVMDFSRDGSLAGRYTRQELAPLQRGRLLLAYLSIAEAQNRRSYWQKSWRAGRPAWLGKSGGDTYKVRYWDPAWQKIVFDYTDQIVAQGFDGVYLDTVDSYEYWQPQYPQAREQMRQLIKRLARRLPANFGLFLNGGEALLDDPQLLKITTGVAREEIFLGRSDDTLLQLKKLVKAGKLVLSIDYTHNPREARQAHQQARKAGFLEYVTVPALDRLIAQPR